MKFVPMWLGFFVALIFIAGIVVDGQGKTQTFQQALTVAQSAARAGTNAATGTSVNGDAFDLSIPAAVSAAENYITAAGATGTVTVNGNEVFVTVDMAYTPRILWMIGPLPVQATGSAALIDD
ncbi:MULTISPECIES: DUF3060 domain-containing protein [Microbacterium]|jgi:hypothetical protein|uniref:DUF3060 domain-containing protein n=1 Tax=Microbacterium sp. H37-C3 TaxID=3004354 RepID=UPI0022AF4EBB|nr:DUF3060 domain-containing protein [Microbacterium sp. H37-C3]MCZ4068930.1 DUF3060 domain-containing protein [Microbacterium sp. H37-C3]